MIAKKLLVQDIVALYEIRGATRSPKNCYTYSIILTFQPSQKCVSEPTHQWRNYGEIGNTSASYLTNLSCELMPAPLAISFAAA